MTKTSPEVKSVRDQKTPRFAITLALLDDDGKIIVGASGGSNSIFEVTSVKNFRELCKEFRRRVQDWYKDQVKQDQLKEEWTEDDQRAADERKAKLAEALKGNK